MRLARAAPGLPTAAAAAVAVVHTLEAEVGGGHRLQVPGSQLEPQLGRPGERWGKDAQDSKTREAALPLRREA